MEMKWYGVIIEIFSAKLYPGIENFCFPSGVTTTKVDDNSYNNTVLKMKHSQSHQIPMEQHFVFLFSDATANIFYGTCIHRTELFDVSGIMDLVICY